MIRQVSIQVKTRIYSLIFVLSLQRRKGRNIFLFFYILEFFFYLK